MGASLESITVLHIDDDPGFADLVADFLEREDERIRVLSETRVDDAQRRLNEAAVDCVVSDYEMPGMDGIEFLKVVRETHPELPFILYTGKGSEEVASEAIRAGVTDYIQKGGGTDRYTLLANRIQNAVSHYRTTDELAHTRARYRSLFREMNEGMAVHELVYDAAGQPVDYRVVAVNPQFESILEREKDAVEGNLASDIYQPDDPPYLETYTSVVETGKSIEFETFYEPLEKHIHVSAFSLDGGTFATVFYDITEPKERERELETLIDNLPGMVYRCQNEEGWPMDQVGGDVEALTGYTPSDLEGEDGIYGSEIIHPDDQETVWRTIQEALEDGELFKLTYRIYSRDGSMKWVRERGQGVRTDDGELRGLEGFITDITQTKIQERELSETNTVLRTIVENLPAGILVEYADRDILMANDTLGEVLGAPLSGEALIGRDCIEALEEIKDLFVDPEAYLSGISQRIDDRRPVYNEVFELSDGRTIERDYIPYSLPEGEANLWLYRDVTDRTQRKQELERAREEYQELFNGMNDSAFVINFDGNILAVNDAAVETLGYPREDFLTRKIQDLDVSFDDDEIVSLIERMPSDEKQVFETVHRTKEGAEIPVEVSSSIVTYGGEKAILSIARDVSGRKQREKRLERFASVVSHDLRNPLTVADGRLKLAQEECDSEHLEVISQAHERMDVLIQQLLTLARQGGDMSELGPVALPDLARESWENVETAAGTIQIEVDESLRADRSRLQQLFENLYRNAIEHGGEDVRVTVGSLQNGFYVADDGPGIPENRRSAVLDSGYSSSENGTGYGLSIVKHVADAHDWEIQITESSDGGARFEFHGVSFLL